MNPLGINPDRTVEPAPDQTAFDYGMLMAKVGTIAFPFLGLGVTLFDLVTAPSRNKRLSDWCDDHRDHLNDVSRKVDGLTPEKLAKDEAFISAFAQATQAAIRTHHAEKREALRNAVLNVAIGNAPSEDQQAIFFGLIDRFTPLHLQILRFLIKDGSTRPNVPNDLSNQVMLDLNAAGLLNDGRANAARGRDYSDLLTDLGANWTVNSVGKQFLDFIREPQP